VGAARSMAAAWTPPPVGAVHVWRVCLRHAARKLERLPLPLPLSAEEVARAEMMASPTGRARYAAGRVALRTILSKYEAGSTPASLRIAASSSGKPHLLSSAPDMRFSVAHTGDTYVAAVGRGVDVGVDVEPLDRELGDVGRLARRWLHPEEARRVGGDAHAFLRAWTRKEAYVKAVGAGVARGRMRQFCFDASGRVRGEDWVAEDFCFDGVFVGSVVSPSDGGGGVDEWFTY
jgi:4'-phosphopantetheinyl transferase